MSCVACGKNEELPFTCPYCHQTFCMEHRLPENHACPKAPPRDLVDYVYAPAKEKAQVNKAIKNVEDKFWHKLRRKIGL